MRRQLAAGIALVMLLAGTGSAAEVDPAPELETYLVTGEQPGPGLWKVSRGDHVLWILGTHGPLPRGMTWSAKEASARIRESSQVLHPGSVLVRGPAPPMNPKGVAMKELLPPDVYQQWRQLKDRYARKDDDIEKMRPMSALQNLRYVAVKAHGLDWGFNTSALANRVDRIARKHGVTVRRLPDQNRWATSSSPPASCGQDCPVVQVDAVCFAARLAALEPQIEEMKRRANAWSRGDIEDLRSRVVNSQSSPSDCLTTPSEIAESMKREESFREPAREAGVTRDQQWFDAVQKALLPIVVSIGLKTFLCAISSRSNSLSNKPHYGLRGSTR